MSDLVSYNDEFITFQNPNGIQTYTMSGELELLSSVMTYTTRDCVSPELATVPRRDDEVTEWQHANVYAFKVNYIGSDKHIGPYGSSGTGRRLDVSGYKQYVDWTGKIKEGNYLNLFYNDSANFKFDLNWSAMSIPNDAEVSYRRIAYVYGGTDFMHKSAEAPVSSRIYVLQGNIVTGSDSRIYNTPLSPSSFSASYNKDFWVMPTTTGGVGYFYKEDEIVTSRMTALANYQDMRVSMYLYQAFNGKNGNEYEYCSAVSASGGTVYGPPSYSGLKMWAGNWTATISGLDTPELIVY